MIWEGLDVPTLPGFTGFVPPAGTGATRVCILGEAPGEVEARTGIPFHPKAPAGSVFERLLTRAGLDRSAFLIANACWSRPPNNHLADTPYEGEALAAYQPFLNRMIERSRPKVILALGNTAMRAATDFAYGGRKATISQVQGYVLDSMWPGVHVICALHPSAIMRGKQEMSGVVIWAMQRAMAIARDGFVRLPTQYIVHPSLEDAEAFERGYVPERHILSYDIETAESSTLDEEEVEDHDEDISYQITRISFCYDAGNHYAISLPWQPPFIEIARRLLNSGGAKRVWNGNFDNPRLAAASAPVMGRIYDSMWAWKHLQPTLPRSLGFVAPFYGWTGEPWKHTSTSEPERYSAADAHALQMIGDGVDEHLRQKGMWRTYERHVVELGEVLGRMSQNGLPYSKERAGEFERELQGKWDARYAELQRRVPDELKPSKQKEGLKKEPKDTAGYVQREFKVWHQDKDLLGTIGDIVTVVRWCKLEPFLPTSTQQVQQLLKHAGLPVGRNRKTGQASADDEHLKKMCKRIAGVRKHADLLVTLRMIRECRQLSKILGTYVKGWRPGTDGRIHATYGFWGKMFRISARNPNVCATVQDKQDENDEYAIIVGQGFRKCVSARPGHVLLEADWKSMEAVLVAYFASDKEYDRLARLGVHDYLTCYILVDRKKRDASTLPDLSWSDADLRACFKEVKRNFPKDRDDGKHCIHGVSYGMTERLMADMYEMQRAEAKRLIDMFFMLFPKIKAWQRSVLDRASRECRLTNPFGYSMPFWEVFRWDGKKNAGKGGYALGEDAKSAIAFLPRDTGAAMLKEALLRLERNHRLASLGIMLTPTHDSILTEPEERNVEDVARILYDTLAAPVPELGGLSIPAELKWGRSWHDDEMDEFPIAIPTTPDVALSQA